MLSRCAGFIAAAALAACALAQAPAGQPAGESASPAEGGADKVVHVDPVLRKGASIDLEITTLKETAKQGEKPGKQKGTIEVKVEVLDVTDEDTSLIAWTQTIPNAAESAAAMGDDPMAAILLAMDGLRLEFGLTAEGELTGLTNFEHVHKRLMTVVDSTIEKRRREGASEEALATAKKLTTELYADQDRTTDVLMKEASLYFQVYGYQLQAGEPLEYETMLGNPLGGELFPASGTWRLDGFSPKAKVVKVRWQQEVEEKEAIRIMIETLRALAEKAGRPASDEDVKQLMKMRYTVSDDGTYTYNRETGFIESLRYKRVNVIDQSRSSETVTIRTRG